MKTKQDFLDTYDFNKIVHTVNALDIKYFDSNMCYVIPTVDFLKNRVSCLFDMFDLYKSGVACDGLFQLTKDKDGNFDLKYIIDAVSCSNAKSVLLNVDFEKIHTVMLLNNIMWTNDFDCTYIPSFKEVTQYVHRLVMNVFLINGTVDETHNNFNIIKYTDSNNVTQYHLSYLI